MINERFYPPHGVVPPYPTNATEYAAPPNIVTPPIPTHVQEHTPIVVDSDPSRVASYSPPVAAKAVATTTGCFPRYNIILTILIILLVWQFIKPWFLGGFGYET